jgi:hypothetical protein
MWHTVDLEDAARKPLMNWRDRMAVFLSMRRYPSLAWGRGSKGSILALLSAKRQVEIESLSGSHLP